MFDAFKAHRLAAQWWTSADAVAAREAGAVPCGSCRSPIPPGRGHLCAPSVMTILARPVMICRACFKEHRLDAWRGSPSDFDAVRALQQDPHLVRVAANPEASADDPQGPSRVERRIERLLPAWGSVLAFLGAVAIAVSEEIVGQLFSGGPGTRITVAIVLGLILRALPIRSASRPLIVGIAMLGVDCVVALFVAKHGSLDAYVGSALTVALLILLLRPWIVVVVFVAVLELAEIGGSVYLLQRPDSAAPGGPSEIVFRALGLIALAVGWVLSRAERRSRVATAVAESGGTPG